MKSLFARITMALLIASLASVSIFAKTKRETVTFPTDIKVNGTLVRRGEYDLKFDDKTGELAIVKNGKVVAKANTSSAKREEKARRFSFRVTGTGSDLQLSGDTFAGAEDDLMISGSQASR